MDPTPGRSVTENRSLEGPSLSMQQLTSDEELRLIHHLAPVGLLTLDAKCMVRQANHTACELMGMRQPVCRVAPLAAYVDPASCEELFAHIGRVFRGAEEASQSLRFRRRDGQINWIQLHSRLYTQTAQAAPMCFSALLDVTKQRRAEQAIRHSEQSFRDLLAQLPDGVVVLSGQILDYANRRFARIVGERNPERLVGCGFADYLHPDEVGEFRQWLARMSDANCKDRVTEFRMSSRQGRAMVSEVTAIPMVLSGRLVMVLVVRDVTHSRRMRADLEQANRLATVGVLAAGVAHEINNPLNYIMLNLETARRDLEDSRNQCEPEERDALDEVDDRLGTALLGTERVRDIVKSLNSFARVDVRPTRIRVREVIEKASAMAVAEIRLKAKLVVDVDDSTEVTGVEGRLCQVVLNLLVNAAHAIEDGRPEEHEIRVSTHTFEDRVCITVSDTGTGIAEDRLSKIFDPFYTTKAPGKGSGLGLSLCRNYIHSHGGRIHVTSELGRGSQFHVELPVLHEGPADVTPIDARRVVPTSGQSSLEFDARPAATRRPPKLRSVDAVAPSAARRRVLVVDDEELIRGVLGAVLQERYEVETAYSGDDALAKIRANQHYDLVLCDLMMAEGSGMDVYASLANDDPDMCERIVFLTGGAHTEESSEFLEDVDPPVAFKPLAREEVLSIVEDAIACAERKASERGSAELGAG